MNKLLADTCVWLDLASDPNGPIILSKMEQLITSGNLRLLVPQIVLDEFDKHRPEIETKIVQRYTSHLGQAKEAVRRFADKEKKAAILDDLESVSRKLRQSSNAAAASCQKIESLFERTETQVLEITDNITRLACKRGLEKKAPFIKNKNATADAIIMESFSECVMHSGTEDCQFFFVTANTHDFSQADGDENFPHPDFAPIFCSPRVRYFINIASCLNEVKGNSIPVPVVAHIETLRHPKGPRCPYCRKPGGISENPPSYTEFGLLTRRSDDPDFISDPMTFPWQKPSFGGTSLFLFCHHCGGQFKSGEEVVDE